MVEEQVSHPLAPIFDAHSRVLILGTMPSPASRAAAFYYAHPQNRFWPALARVLGEPAPQDHAACRQLALRRGIALWDTLAACTIAGASDASIKNAVANDFAPIFHTASIQAVFTTGKKAEQMYKKYSAPLWQVPQICLPSPSPANCAVSFDALCESYRQILPFLREEGL